MKKFRKTMLICMVFFYCATSPVFSQDLGNLQQNVDRFTDSISHSLPFYTKMGLNWSDAYIGHLFSIPPRFGIGVSAGVTTMDFTPVNNLMNVFNMRLPLSSGMSLLDLPLPGYIVEVRLGGMRDFPFDIGVKASYVAPGLFSSVVENFYSTPVFDFKHTLIGGDIRFALLRAKVLPVRLSLGVGINYLDGGITSTGSIRSSFAFEDPDNGDTFTLSSVDPQLGIEWKTTNVELKLQTSFPFKIITPYAGIGVGYSWIQAGYRVKTSELSVDNGGLEDDIKQMLLETYRFTNVSETGFETIRNINSFNSRIFGGISFNFLVIRLDFTAMYDLIGGNMGGTLGLRLQL
jgi:hypothetical protein